jgi:hypothetical protein
MSVCPVRGAVSSFIVVYFILQCLKFSARDKDSVAGTERLIETAIAGMCELSAEELTRQRGEGTASEEPDEQYAVIFQCFMLMCLLPYGKQKRWGPEQIRNAERRKPLALNLKYFFLLLRVH